jgi:hypothetical protein
MLKKLAFTAVVLLPAAALAGGGGANTDTGTGMFLIEAMGRLISKLSGLF